MRRFLLTNTGINSLACKISNDKVFIPTAIEVEGTAKTGYELHYVDTERCGFKLINGKLKTMYAVKRLVEAINEGREKEYPANYFTVGCFAWKSHNLYKV